MNAMNDSMRYRYCHSFDGYWLVMDDGITVAKFRGDEGERWAKKLVAYLRKLEKKA